MYQENDLVKGSFHGHKFTGKITKVETNARDNEVTNVFIQFDKDVKVSGYICSGISLKIHTDGSIVGRTYDKDFIEKLS